MKRIKNKSAVTRQLGNRSPVSAGEYIHDPTPVEIGSIGQFDKVWVVEDVAPEPVTPPVEDPSVEDPSTEEPSVEEDDVSVSSSKQFSRKKRK